MTTEEAPWLQPPELWLSQGDVFMEVPVLDYEVQDGRPTATTRQGPAMLVSHNCSLDKRSRGVTTVERLNFVELRELASLEESRRNALVAKKADVQPYGTLVLGEIAGYGDFFAVLADTFWLPAAYFATSLRHDDKAGEEVLFAYANDSRAAMLSEACLELFKTKWNIHWTRRRPLEG